MNKHFESRPQWSIRLGLEFIGRMTYLREPGDPLRLLGSVRKGMQFGALAVLPDGQYVSVIGDHLTPLPKGQIQRVLESLRRPASLYVRRAPPTPVIIRRRRVPQYG